MSSRYGVKADASSDPATQKSSVLDLKSVYIIMSHIAWLHHLFEQVVAIEIK